MHSVFPLRNMKHLVPAEEKFFRDVSVVSLTSRVSVLQLFRAWITSTSLSVCVCVCVCVLWSRCCLVHMSTNSLYVLNPTCETGQY